MVRTYLPALVFVSIGTTIGLIFASLNSVLGPNGKRRSSKFAPYECGLPSEVKQNFRFGVSFYLIAMLFILFDIEVIFLYPIAVQLKSLGMFAVVETVIFITLLTTALVYAWRRGALDWR